MRKANQLRGAAALACLPLAAGCGWQSYASGSARLCQSPSQTESMADQVLRLINLERINQNPSLDALGWDDELARVADDFACRMIEGDFFGHVDPDTKTQPSHRLTLAGYAFSMMGENLAVGQTTPAEVVDRWMQSRPHRANLLSRDWRRAGIGVRADDQGTLYWVLELADPAL